MDSRYIQTANNQFSQRPAPLPPVANQSQRRSWGKTVLIIFLVLLFLCGFLVAGLIMTWDYLFEKDPDFNRGVELAWSAQLPKSEDFRYVEPINDKKVVLFSVSAKRIVSAFDVEIPSEADKNVKAKVKSVGELPACQSDSSRPYRLVNAKITCNTVEDETIDSARIADIESGLLKNLGERVRLAGKEQGFVFVYSSGKKESHLLGLDSRNGLLWEKAFSGPINVTAKDGYIWVVEKNQLSVFHGSRK